MKYIFACVALAALLAACGGGGGGATPPTSGPPPTQTPTATPSTTTASGKVVDRATSTALAGVSVAIEPWTYPSTPIPEATTASDGTFSFTAPNGHYLLIVGSDSASDTRATVHDSITLKGGPQVLAAPTAFPEPSVTPPASETSGAYRLMTLDTQWQTPCLSATNTQRANLGLAALVPDEWLEENAEEIHQAQLSLDLVGLGSGAIVSAHNTNGSGQADCAAFVATDYVAGMPTWSTDQVAMSPYTVWFGGAFSDYQSSPPVGDGYDSYALDPQIETPCPSPPPSPLPTPGPDACDPYYLAWP
jgi:hypothetical protein